MLSSDNPLNRFVLACACALMLAGCGFQPLYGERSLAGGETVRAAMNDVYIDNIPDREGQFLRNRLMDRMYSAGRPDSARYILKIRPVAETRRGLGITKSSDATRAQLRLTSIMELRDRQTDKVVLTRDLQAITSYNILESQFTTRVSEQAARESALEDLARQVETNLALYFRRN